MSESTSCSSSLQVGQETVGNVSSGFARVRYSYQKFTPPKSIYHFFKLGFMGDALIEMAKNPDVVISPFARSLPMSTLEFEQSLAHNHVVKYEIL